MLQIQSFCWWNYIYVVSPASNHISTFIFNSNLYYYFIFNIPANLWPIYSGFKWKPFFFIGYLWLIDITSVRNISYDIFVSRMMVFSQHIVSSYLVTSIHFPCNCTVHVYLICIRRRLFCFLILFLFSDFVFVFWFCFYLYSVIYCEEWLFVDYHSLNFLFIRLLIPFGVK